MKRTVSIIALLLAFAIWAPQVQATDVSSAYNSLRATYHFPAYPTNTPVTWASGYSGSNYASDKAALVAGIEHITGLVAPPIGDDDLLNASLNW